MKLKLKQCLFIIALFVLFYIVFMDNNTTECLTQRARCYPINSPYGQMLAAGTALPSQATSPTASTGSTNKKDEDWTEWFNNLGDKLALNPMVAFFAGILAMYLLYMLSKVFWKMVENKLVDTLDLDT